MTRALDRRLLLASCAGLAAASAMPARAFAQNDGAAGAAVLDSDDSAYFEFAPGSADIPAGVDEIISGFAQHAIQSKRHAVRVTGVALIGEPHAADLAKRRAAAVAARLVALGVRANIVQESVRIVDPSKRTVFKSPAVDLASE
jgi:outer membrane protein OmpA-like peptidoglycan-associated protein